MDRSRKSKVLLVAGALMATLVIGVVIGRATRSSNDEDAVTSPTSPTQSTDASSATDTDTDTDTSAEPPVTTAGTVSDGGYVWRPVRIGGGGNISGIDAADDGGLIARSDTYGAYLRPGGSAEWQQLMSTAALPEEFHVPKLGKGVQAVAIAPSDSSRLYVMWVGHVLVSRDGGASFVTSSFEPVLTDANANFGKGFGDKMTVDPANPDVVLAGGPDVPLRISTDGGTTWSETTLPAGQPQSRLNEEYAGEIRSVGTTGLAFDRTSPVVDGRTSVVYAASWGNGIYRSDDGGVTWTAIGGPTDVHHASIDAAGAYYATSGEISGPFSIQRYADGAWTDITPEGWNPGFIAGVENPFIAASPTVAGTVVLGYAPQLFITRDGGDSWNEMSWHDGTGDITWAQNPNEDYYLVSSDLIFDPVTPDRIWMTTGEGVQWATLDEESDDLTWIEATKGIENMVPTDVASMIDAPPVFGVFDFGQFSGSSNLDDLSLRKGPVDFFSGTTSLAASPFEPGFAVGVTTDYVSSELPISSSYTEDGGQTWTRFASMPKDATSAKEFGFGAIAVSTPDNIVWAPGRYQVTETDDFQPYYTLDRGRSWNPVELPGVTAYPPDAIGGYMFGKNRQAVVADEVKPGVFYLTMLGEGLFRTVDGGVTWERIHDGEFSLGQSDFGAQIGALPGAEGNLFFTDGAAGGHNFTGPQEHSGWPFMRSTDGGATWAPVTGVDKVLTFGFGKAAPDSPVGTIYLAGNVRDDYGIWRSVDNAETWTKIADYPLSVDWLGVISGDRNTFGTVYIGGTGSSYAYGVPA